MAFGYRSYWSISSEIGWSISSGIGGQFKPKSGGQFLRNLQIEEESPKFTYALKFFTDLIGDNLRELIEINVSLDMITFWYMYEYEHQCNMEFSPDITKRIGELGIVLCIS